jgi:hypothetical protein
VEVGHEPEAAQDEVGRREPKHPVEGLPGRHASQVAAWAPQDHDTLGEALAEASPPPPADHEEDDRTHRGGDAEPGRELRVLEQPEPVDRRQSPNGVEPGQHAERDRPDEQRDRDERVEDGLDEEARRESRIRRALDPVLREVELHDVAAARREDRVDADAGRVGAEDAPPAHVCLGVRLREHVAPRARAGDQLQEVAERSEGERAPAQSAEALDERVGRAGDAVHGG